MQNFNYSSLASLPARSKFRRQAQSWCRIVAQYSTMNLSELEASDGATDIIRGVLGDFPELGDTGPFTTDLQYMRVNEAKYLVLLYELLCVILSAARAHGAVCVQCLPAAVHAELHQLQSTRDCHQGPL